MKGSNTVITAHAGSDGYKPNSYEFIQSMLDSNVDALEIDCQMSSKSEVYLSHDPLDDYSEALSLIDVYQLLIDSNNTKIILNVDCKQDSIPLYAINKAKEFGVFNQIVISGKINISDINPADRNQLFFNLENLIDISKLSSMDISELRDLLQDLYSKGIRKIQLPYTAVFDELLHLLNEMKLKLCVWTVDDSLLIKDLLNRGCYNITTNIALDYLHSNED